MKFALNGAELEDETTMIFPIVKPETILFWKLFCEACALEIEELAIIPDI